jgi:predicted metalloprotease
MNGLNLQATGPSSDSVRLELQADCFAGSWVGAASTTKDVNGVPFLEQSTQGQVNPESFTHGSAQRETWFNVGLTQGAQACDTFGANASGQ